MEKDYRTGIIIGLIIMLIFSFIFLLSIVSDYENELNNCQDGLFECESEYLDLVFELQKLDMEFETTKFFIDEILK